MNHQGYALFIQPSGSLRDSLIEWKSWLENTLPGQPLCGHPPHCTLLFGSYEHPDIWLEDLRRRFSTFAPFELATDGWKHFQDDPLTGGGQTIAFRVKPTRVLSELQMIAATTLMHYYQRDFKHPLWDREPFATSQKIYGSPFVGEHWIPHFTIASPLVSSESPLLAELQSCSANHSCLVERISVWHIEANEHRFISELALGLIRT